MPSKKRSLLQCAQSRCLIDLIYCAKGYILGNDSIDIRQLERGDPLEFTVCQNCKDYSEMGPPIPKSERGWLNLLTK